MKTSPHPHWKPKIPKLRKPKPNCSHWFQRTRCLPCADYGNLYFELVKKHPTPRTRQTQRNEENKLKNVVQQFFQKNKNSRLKRADERKEKSICGGGKKMNEWNQFLPRSRQRSMIRESQEIEMLIRYVAGKRNWHRLSLRLQMKSRKLWICPNSQKMSISPKTDFCPRFPHDITIFSELTRASERARWRL